MWHLMLFPFLNPIEVKKGDSVIIHVDERQYSGTVIGIMRDNLFIETLHGDLGIPMSNISSIDTTGTNSPF